LASALSMMKVASGSARRQPIGTITTPARAAPKNRVK